RNLLIDAMNYARVITDGNGKTGLANPGTNVPRISSDQVANDNNYGVISSRYVEDGSYLKLKNISLSYSIPAKYIGYTRVIKGLRLTAGAQNVFTLTHYKGYDPEIGAYVGTGSSSANQAIGIDFGRYPLTPMYTATVSVNF
ncbi:MAG: TonB-dependent receptor, partial [Flavisolibacter sp.]